MRKNLLAQPGQSVDLNINDLEFFESLNSRGSEKPSGFIDNLVEGFKRLFFEYKSEALERVWQSLSNRYSQVFRKFGGNDFKIEHTWIIKSQPQSTLARSVEVDQEVSKAALDW